MLVLDKAIERYVKLWALLDVIRNRTTPLIWHCLDAFSRNKKKILPT